jgi:hypothetical protein
MLASLLISHYLIETHLAKTFERAWIFGTHAQTRQSCCAETKTRSARRQKSWGWLSKKHGDLPYLPPREEDFCRMIWRQRVGFLTSLDSIRGAVQQTF